MPSETSASERGATVVELGRVPRSSLNCRYSEAGTIWLHFGASPEAIAYTEEFDLGLIDFDESGNIVCIQLFPVAV